MNLSEFQQQQRDLDASAFLAAFDHPFLLLSGVAPTFSSGTLGVLTRTDSQAELIQALRDVRVFPVRKQESNAFSLMVTLGRAANNDIVIDHPGISKFHAYLRCIGSQWSLSDANSSNGTSVNGARLPGEHSRILTSGDELVLGDVVQLQFLDAQGMFDTLHMVD